AVLPPLISVTTQFCWRVLCAEWVFWIVVSSFGMTAEAESDGVFQIIGTILRLLNDVVYVNIATGKLVADATTAVCSHECLCAYGGRRTRQPRLSSRGWEACRRSAV